MKSSKIRKSVVFFVLITALFAVSPARSAAARQTAIVESVLSGDTVHLRGGKELRYIGLETYSIKSGIALVQQYGQEALEFNRKLVEGKTVQIEWGPQLRTKNNQLLGYVFLEDGTFVNRKVLENGHAKLRIQPPNLRYAEEFRVDELEAHRAKRGLWAKEPDDPHLSSAVLGNKIGKIYYYPNSPELDDVPEAQIVPFRSRVEAVAAGYKPCYSCRNHATESPEALDNP